MFLYGMDDLLNVMYVFTAPKGMYSRVQLFVSCIYMRLKLTDLVKVSCQLLGVITIRHTSFVQVQKKLT